MYECCKDLRGNMHFVYESGFPVDVVPDSKYTDNALRISNVLELLAPTY